jgi:HEAT repeat protein
MITPEQTKKTEAHLAAADHEFAAGNPLAATERLWDAVVCTLSAVAQHKGWPHSNRDELYDVATRLNELDDEDEPLLSGFSSVEGGPDRVRFALFAVGDGRDEDARMVAKWVIGMIRDLDARHDDVSAKSAR